MESIGPILTIIATIMSILLKAWQDGQPARIEEKKYENRAAIVDGDAGSVAIRIDRLLSETTDNHAGSKNDKDGTGDASTLARLAALGCCDESAAGKG